jgi:hypothetical protein
MIFSYFEAGFGAILGWFNDTPGFEGPKSFRSSCLKIRGVDDNKRTKGNPGREIRDTSGDLINCIIFWDATESCSSSAISSGRVSPDSVYINIYRIHQVHS